MLRPFQNVDSSKRRNCTGRMKANERENFTESNSSRRRRRSITLAQEVDVLNRKARGDKNSKISRDLDLHQGTVRRIVRHKDQIMEKVNAASGCPALQSHAKNRSLSIIRMEYLLSQWIEDCNKKKLALGKTTIRAKALRLFGQVKKERNEMTSKETFRASRTWYFGFMKRLKSQSGANFREVDNTNDAAMDFPEDIENAAESAPIDKTAFVYDVEDILLVVDMLKQKVATTDYNAARSMKIIEGIDKTFFPYKQICKENKKTMAAHLSPD